MRKWILLANILMVMNLLFISCKKEQNPNLPSAKAYLSKISGLNSSSLSFNYDLDNNLTELVQASMKFRYTSDKQVYYLSITPQSQAGGDNYIYSVNNDANSHAAKGLRTNVKFGNNSGASGTGSSGVTLIDTIQYQVTNGNITEVKFANRKTISTKYPNFPSTTGAYQDTSLTIAGVFETYTIDYQNGNIARIHFQDNTGKIIDQEYTYGTHKSPLLDSRIKPLLWPDLLIGSSNLPVYLFLYYSNSDNEMLKMRTTYVNQNNKTEENTCVYTFDQYQYPLTMNYFNASGNKIDAFNFTYR